MSKRKAARPKENSVPEAQPGTADDAPGDRVRSRRESQITHHRTVDTLRLMLEAGNITAAMHDAARDFQAAFTVACFEFNATREFDADGSIALGRAPRLRFQRCSARSTRARGARARCARWPRLAGRFVRLARRWHAELDPRMGAAAGLGRAAGAAGECAGNSRCCARCARKALRHPRHWRSALCVKRFTSRINGLQTKCIHDSFLD